MYPYGLDMFLHCIAGMASPYAKGVRGSGSTTDSYQKKAQPHHVMLTLMYSSSISNRLLSMSSPNMTCCAVRGADLLPGSNLRHMWVRFCMQVCRGGSPELVGRKALKGILILE